jgi:hypothetical protein
MQKIVVPYFERKKRELGFSSDQTCIVQLDVWSVHRSEAFRSWVRQTYPWITLDFVPGGCTGLWQVCDVGIQRPFKQSIRRSQLDDIVAETMQHLEDGVSPAEMRIAKEIGELRDRCVRWFVDAYDTINNSALICKAWERCVVGSFNLSFESVTSSDTVAALLELPTKDPAFWAELVNGNTADAPVDAPVNLEAIDEKEDRPFEDADHADEDTLDSSTDPFELINSFLADAPGDIVETATAPSLAETVEPGELTFSPDVQAVDFRRGKRRKTKNTQYTEYLAH